MTRKRFDMILDDNDRENLEFVKAVYGVSMSKMVRYGLALAFDRLGIKKADIEEVLKKK
jgi:hypothetical protein